MQRRAVLSLLLAALVPLRGGAEEGWDLVTAAEAAGRVERPTERALRRLETAGPEIVIHAPEATALVPPLTFDVEFRARGGVPPMMESLRLDYDMGLFWKDVTKRLLARARIEGTRIRAAGARLPPGRHVLRVRIMDAERRATVSVIDLVIEGT